MAGSNFRTNHQYRKIIGFSPRDVFILRHYVSIETRPALSWHHKYSGFKLSRLQYIDSSLVASFAVELGIAPPIANFTSQLLHVYALLCFAFNRRMRTIRKRICIWHRSSYCGIAAFVLRLYTRAEVFKSELLNIMCGNIYYQTKLLNFY